MKQSIEYKTIDGRGDHESFRDCVTEALKTLKPNEGLHLIKDFEPFPLYKMMESKGFEKEVVKISDSEYHAYFYKPFKLEDIQMKDHLFYDSKRIADIVQIKVDYLKGDRNLEDSKTLLIETVGTVTSQEFAVAEQHLMNHGVTDDELAERIEEIVVLFEGILKHETFDVPEGHPVHTYMLEVKAIRALLKDIKEKMSKKFIKNQWLEIFDQLDQINVHFARKQNQVYPLLESKGFDKPSRVMWTLENNIRDQIKKTLACIENETLFISMQTELIDMIEDMMVKEEEILFPTVLDMISEEEFYAMRLGDDEIGYCLVETPVAYGSSKLENEGSFQDDLMMLLSKHGLGHSNGVLDVSQGQLTLNQINMIFKHLPMDLSFVDENELVKFYSDTKHRVFPRSPGVIGRAVQNCHPKDSVYMVEEIIRAFKSGEQDEAEFWLEINGRFIYIIYVAVRDDTGQYKGILEMMQDVTKIKSLEGSQRLLSWDKDRKIHGDTKVGELIQTYPYVKDVLLGLSPKFKKLNNPVLFKTMASVATLEMIAKGAV